MRLLALSLLLAALASATFGCSSDVAARVRKHTYPPTFRYFTDAELKGTMWQLASFVSQIDIAMRDSEVDSPTAVSARREKVDQLLGQMQDVSRALGPGGWPSNHPVIGPNVERFRLDLASARRALSFDPPNFYLAGSIAGSCLHCHASN